MTGQRYKFFGMATLKAHFDGKALIPDEPVDLPLNCALEIQVKPIKNGGGSLAELARQLEKLPMNPDWPTDGAAQHDHYLYGTPKRK
jgi:hypothetical protein